jgi:tetratricopeptide (TPR) repeat protein
MNTIKYLEQAKLADSLGKYKLADNLYAKAVRLAAPPPTSTIFVELADKALIEAAERALQAALRSGDEAAIRQALRERGFTEAGIEALEKAQGSLSRINITNVNTAIAESAEGAFEMAANQIRVNGGKYFKLDSHFN